jgi:hypothetical protein
VHPVRLVEVGAVRRAAEQGAFADQLEVTPGEQRIACHVVFLYIVLDCYHENPWRLKIVWLGCDANSVNGP